MISEEDYAMTLKEALRQIREGKHSRIANAVAKCRHLSYAQIGHRFNCSKDLVFNVARANGLSRSKHKEKK